jgi:signal peptidase
MRILARSTAFVRRFLDAVLIAMILVVVFGVILAKVVPVTGRQTIIVGGKSMEPAIAMGSAIIVAPVPASELHVGDVVSLRAGDERALFTHRITEIFNQPDGILVRTKGDANEKADPTLVAAADIEGRVELAVPLAGYLIAMLSIPAGVLFLIGLAATLLAAVWLLESLELDRIDRTRIDHGVNLGPELGPVLGEPLSPRPMAGRTLAAGGAFGSVRWSVADQIARSRATREQRDRWQAAAQERADPRSD